MAFKLASPAAYGRLVRAGFVLAREGVFQALPREDAPWIVRLGLSITDLIARSGTGGLSQAERLTTALNRLGPSYIKMGQFLATRPDIVGADMAAGLGRLRDEVPPFGDGKARAVIETNLNRSVDTLFADFSEPIAAASIAQVHKARIEVPDIGVDGETDTLVKHVAVKVLRPDVRRRFSRDLDSFYAAAHLLELVSPASRRLRPVAVVDTLARSTVLEMDLRLEAAALSEMAELSKDEPYFAVPTIDWDRTGRDVLTIDWIDGLKLTDLEALDAAGLDRPALAVRLIQTFLRHAVDYGFFHADMHQGNLFVEETGVIKAIDFGIMGRIGPAERRFLAEILYGFIRRDYLRIAEVHFEAGYVPPKHSVEDFAQALRAVGEPIHGQSADDISMASLLGLLFEITELFDMKTRTELIMLQKTMVVVEGVARSLDENFDMWSAAEPVVRDWLTKNLGPSARLEQAAEGVSAIGRLLKDLPELAERASRLSKLVEEETEAAQERRQNGSGRMVLLLGGTVLVTLALTALF